MPFPPPRCRAWLITVLTLLVAVARPTHAELFMSPPADPARVCDAAIALAERNHTLPAHLLGAIGRVESGRRDPLTGAIVPWPWSINVEGEPHIYDTEAVAIAAVRQFQAAGRRSIDVGCMQINLKHHPDAFADLETAFDPVANTRYAADFLTELHDPGQDWLVAAGLYHSATPALAVPYRLRVAELMGGDAGFRLAALGGEVRPLTRFAPIVASASMPLMPPAGAPGMVLRRMVMRTTERPAMKPTGLAGRGLAAYRASTVALAAVMLPPG